MAGLFLTLALTGPLVSRGVSADADWLGHSRAEVLTTLGKPVSELNRGDTEVLLFPNNVRVEIRADQVVAFRSGSGPVIVSSDGTRYTPGDLGKVKRVDETAASSTPPPPSSAEPAAPAETKTEKLPEVVPSSVVAPAEPPVPEELIEAAGEPKDLDSQMLKLAGHPEDLSKFTGNPKKPSPAWMKPTEIIINVVVRFAVALLILRLAIAWVELPVYLPDLAKVSAIYTIIREGLHAVGEMDGKSGFISMFRLDDVFSFVALCLLLYAFKIALNGITVLRIAGVTKLATYFVMMLVGLALIFGFAALR